MFSLISSSRAISTIGMASMSCITGITRRARSRPASSASIT
ncbi:hypothetical protein [Sorangium sp. So ce854]